MAEKQVMKVIATRFTEYEWKLVENLKIKLHMFKGAELVRHALRELAKAQKK